MTEKTLPKITSFAVPTEADFEAWVKLDGDTRREIIFAELERRSNEPARHNVTPDDIIKGARTRMAHG